MSSSKFFLNQIIKRRFSGNIAPVQLAYASYEGTKSADQQEKIPLIIHHGIFGSKSNWNTLSKVYHQKTFRKVIAIDARNHGESPHSQYHTYDHMVEDLRNLLILFNIKKVALLGHSMGGRTVMYFALKYPELVERLIVADSSPIAKSVDLKYFYTIFDILQKLKMPKDVSMLVARRSTDSDLAKHVNSKTLRQFLLTNLVQKPDKSYGWRINIKALMQNFDDISSFPFTNDMQYGGPVLFVGGGYSKFIKKTDHSKILLLFPNAKFAYIEKAGHWLHSEKPSEFLQLTLEFLNRT